jgi:hypothetical protein
MAASDSPGYLDVFTASQEEIAALEPGTERFYWNMAKGMKFRIVSGEGESKSWLETITYLTNERVWEKLLRRHGGEPYGTLTRFIREGLEMSVPQFIEGVARYAGPDAVDLLKPHLPEITMDELTATPSSSAGSSKATRLNVLREMIPATAEVAQMLDVWEEIDQRYWRGDLIPCWPSCNIEPYGKCIGSWTQGTRTLNLVPSLFRTNEATAVVWGVMAHECAHQAQGQLYRHLDQAKGPRGRWTDSSHRYPSWSRALEDVIQQDGLDVFCPVWHRSTGNTWRPWVPASADWMTWRMVSPDDTFDGRRLLTFEEARSFVPGVDLRMLVAELDPDGEDESGSWML